MATHDPKLRYCVVVKLPSATAPAVSPIMAMMTSLLLIISTASGAATTVAAAWTIRLFAASVPLLRRSRGRRPTPIPTG